MNYKREEPENRKITQIIPADGWFAVYAIENGDDVYAPLACWALVTSDSDPEGAVVGRIADEYNMCAEEHGNFDRYVHYKFIPQEELDNNKTLKPRTRRKKVN